MLIDRSDPTIYKNVLLSFFFFFHAAFNTPACSLQPISCNLVNDCNFYCLFVFCLQLSDRGVAPYSTSPVKTESESSSEEICSGKATVEFLFQLGAEYLSRLVQHLKRIYKVHKSLESP